MCPCELGDGGRLQPRPPPGLAVCTGPALQENRPSALWLLSPETRGDGEELAAEPGRVFGGSPSPLSRASLAGGAAPHPHGLVSGLLAGPVGIAKGGDSPPRVGAGAPAANGAPGRDDAGPARAPGWGWGASALEDGP